MPDHGVWVKAGLYTFDVGSDLANGISMIQCPDNSTINVTSSQDVLSLNEDNKCDIWWGSLTIAAIWIPPAIGYISVILALAWILTEVVRKSEKALLWKLLAAIPGLLLLGVAVIMIALVLALIPVLAPIGM